MQQRSLVRRAADEFRRGNYLAALDLYRRLADRLGETNFRANIWLCQKRLRAQGRRDCTNLDLQAIKVACVMDEFTFHCYAPECNLFPLTPHDATAELEEFGPDLLFIESAWRGKDDLWNRKIGTLSQELRAVLQWCKQRQVPTVFWNKEDPIHFETFLTTAQQFDFVFTTDIDCIARYKAALEHERVYLLPFACQPRLHNPIEVYPRRDAFCFAGAYYVRYPERTRDLENYVVEFPKYKPLEIFDRNFGKDDVNYQFPPEYKPYIVGTLPFHEIDKAYKGYRYAINLNSIKQSQTMFARRVYELLGSNTITVSNFSRGVRLMFGDLVMASDSGEEIVERLRRLDEEASQKLRLAGLRKVMLEHTYQQRLAYVARKALGWRRDNDLPAIAVVAFAGRKDAYQQLISMYQAQRHPRKRLIVVLDENVMDMHMATASGGGIDLVVAQQARQLALGEFVRPGEWLAAMEADDYYGPNYLLDLAIATRYTDVQVIGKATRYQWTADGIQLIGPTQAYVVAGRLPMRCSIIQSEALLEPQRTLMAWLRQTLSEDCQRSGLAVDPFNYCMHGQRGDDLLTVAARVDDLHADTGLSGDELIRTAEAIPPAEFDQSTLPNWKAAKLIQMFGRSRHAQISIEAQEHGLRIASSLPEGAHEYVYGSEQLPIAPVVAKGTIDTYLDATPGLDVQYVFLFLDDGNRKIGHAIHTANRNHTAAVPLGTAYLRMGWRIRGSGSVTIRSLLWGHRVLEPARLLGRGDILVVTNQYPAYDNLYRNAFVHSRVKAYRERGIRVDVFRLRASETTSYHEFQNVDVVTGGAKALRRLLDGGRYKSVLVHFLSEEMWGVLEGYRRLRVIVWLHGSEIQAWHRRGYNYQSDQERAKARRESEGRLAFWRRILRPMVANLKLVFVSRHFAEEVFEDLGFRLPDDGYRIIHNPIDTDLFSYHVKPVEQRKRVLSIRPYASRTYANDLAVAAILALSTRPCFKDMAFRLIGDGKLFEETLEPLRHFPNVIVERRFLAHAEIASLHKDYGVFLVPSRMDSQGVSRDEAMASGLVPVTNAIAAIPEFVSPESGFLCEPENARELAASLETLYENPKLFERMSRAAAIEVRASRSVELIFNEEKSIIFSDGS